MNRLPEYCPEGQFARGLRLRIQDEGFFHQNSGVEVVQFFCGRVGSPINESNTISSEQGKLGVWTSVYECPNGHVIKSIRIKEDPNTCFDAPFDGKILFSYQNILL